MIVAAAVVVAVGLFVVLRSRNDEGSSAATTSATATTTRGQTTTAPAPEPKPPPPARVRIVVRGGEPVGGVRNVTVAKDRRVVLIVTSDVADEIHLHGYNLKRDVEAGGTARLPFKATIVGTVEAELEQRGLPLARITTQP